jgi:hypothetical protein
MNISLLTTLCAFTAGLALEAAEMRTWTSRVGGTLEAQFGSIQGESVILIPDNSREVKLKLADLSLADRQYLVEFGGAPADIITAGKPGLVEKDLRLDTSGFRKLDDKLTLGDSPFSTYELFETPHFLIATAGKIRPQAMAETAERLWYGMAFYHMNFRKDWGDKRMLILMVEDRKAYSELGKWFAARLQAAGQEDAALLVTNSWDKTDANGMTIDEETMKARNLFSTAHVYNVTDDTRFRKPLAAFATHSLAGRLLTHQMRGVSSFGSEGYFAITTGHSYFKEISLAEKSETQLLAVDGTMQDEFSSKRGFEDGSSWARTLRPMVRSGKIEAQLEPMLMWKASDLNPERLVLIYSFAYYMQSDMKRLASYANLIRRIESSNQIPPPIEIAKIFGFETVEELEKDWQNFITGKDFK